MANAVMLHNVVDLTATLSQLAEEGYPVTRELVSRLSPYQTEHIRRFGSTCWTWKTSQGRSS